ncbi:SidA/IucD/PvdA family monooxygenase [Nonomuraea salmonea]|uniref:SidA/IucD/PvdA family monooxygenase n=1 Tax=Nonomuraea salmonea TaxID=46181 RepID=UPI002FEAF4D3
MEADGAIEFLDVVARQGDGTLVTRRARTLVLAAGLEPVLPDGIVSDERVWHSEELLAKLPTLRDPRRFVVVGAGQSAAEVAGHLHGAFPAAEVCAVFAKYGYTPADDSSFANRIFDSEAVDHFYTAPDEVKERLRAYHASTNYSVVDLELIDELYRRHYQEKVQGKERLRIFNASRLAGVENDSSGLRVTVEFLPTGERTPLEADVLVYATGYRPTDPLTLLGETGGLCERLPGGGVRLGRDYRIATSPELRCGIYVQGASEHTHGLTSTLLSNTAVRVGEIAASLTDHLRTPRLPPACDRWCSAQGAGLLAPGPARRHGVLRRRARRRGRRSGRLRAGRRLLRGEHRPGAGRPAAGRAAGAGDVGRVRRRQPPPVPRPHPGQDLRLPAHGSARRRLHRPARPGGRAHAHHHPRPTTG